MSRLPIEFVDFETARDLGGLRMVVVPGVPSPWGEAAKGILHVNGIEWKAVRLDVGNAQMREWIGGTILSRAGRWVAPASQSVWPVLHRQS